MDSMDFSNSAAIGAIALTFRLTTQDHLPTIKTRLRLAWSGGMAANKGHGKNAGDFFNANLPSERFRVCLGRVAKRWTKTIPVNKTRLRNMPLNRKSALFIRALQLSGASMTVERGLWCDPTFPAKSLYSAAENSGRPPVVERQERASR